MKILKGYQPVSVLNNDTLLLYKKNAFYKTDMDLQNIHLVYNPKISLKDKFKSSTRLLQRLFRTNIRTSFVMNEN